MNDKSKTIASSAIIKIICTYIIVCGMVAASEVLHEKEIIFPEIAAIAVGSLLAPKFAWNTSKLKMILGIVICAVLGVCIVRYIPVSLWIQMTIAFILGRIVLMLLRVTFAPMISAIALPVLLQTDSVVYLIVAFLLTSLIVVVRLGLEKYKVLASSEYIKTNIEPDDRRQFYFKELLNITISTVFVAILAFVTLKLGYRFVIAPPLLVAFTEFAKPTSRARKEPVKAISVIFGCALIGSVCRILISMTGGLPLALATAIGLAGVILLMKLQKMYIPPAGAMTVLAMLIPEVSVITFPLQVLVGISVMMVFDMMVFRGKNNS